jgi:hypothetical protein
LYTNRRNEWNNTFVLSLSALMEKHGEAVDIQKIGFPGNWEEIISW